MIRSSVLWQPIWEVGYLLMFCSSWQVLDLLTFCDSACNSNKNVDDEWRHDPPSFQCRLFDIARDSLICLYNSHVIWNKELLITFRDHLRELDSVRRQIRVTPLSKWLHGGQCSVKADYSSHLVDRSSQACLSRFESKNSGPSLYMSIY